MRRRQLESRPSWFFIPQNLSLLICTTLLAACGGGGSGSSTGSANGQASTAVSAPSLTFSVSSESISSGQSVTLQWHSSNADSCAASGGWSGGKETSGSETIGPLQQSESFSLSCSGPGGGTLREVSVNVGGGVSVSLSSNTPAVLTNGQAQLNWNAPRADRCEASGGWSGEQPVNGSYTTQPLTQDTTYKITCFAQGESAVALVTVEVTDKTLRWQAPTENVDGTPLTDLAGFNVYWGNNSRSYTGSQQLAASVREWEIPLGSGTYYLALTALDSESNESSYSNEVRKVIP